ncbi:BglII/BstYI family type II restriction endonuclease [Bacillus sp. V3-13]|uniref:BglII/BstYI family type II restriction endonuclease n=1 Tax=Bacillus sp. V3-13 TaxID=2053728 RepID=UPI0015E08F17|nr:BglII/BstYI family type II restriction endonuclease [Bacillus sp. V3-13]
MKIVRYSHRNGSSVVPSLDIDYLETELQNIEFAFKERSSRKLRETIFNLLRLNGWSSEIKISVESDITISSIKNNIGLCLQTGNISRYYADLLKLQTMFLEEKIYSAIYIIPTKDAAQKMGDNIANLERVIQELEIFRYVITIPIVIIGIEGE